MDTITLRPGESHLVNLPGLGSAGYQWTLQSVDAAIVAVEEVLHSREEVAGRVVGSLDQTFKLTALAPGHTLARFTQQRRFERGGKPHASYEIDVTVTR
jgi:predicted secreted protein